MQISWDENDRKQSAHWRARIPLRWRWGLFVTCAVLLTVVALTGFAVEMEQRAWTEHERNQAIGMVRMIRDTIKLPMTSHDSRATNRILSHIVEQNPEIEQIFLRWKQGETERYGKGIFPPKVTRLRLTRPKIFRVETAGLWFATAVRYADIPLGTLAVRFSGMAWRQRLHALRNRMLLIAAAILLFSWIGTRLLARRTGRSLEALIRAADRVARGDPGPPLPVEQNDEIGDLTARFNRMIHELEQKERIRDSFGKYRRPELVASHFDEEGRGPASQRREVTILVADMVGFAPFARIARPDQVVEVVNHFFSLFHEVITAFDGHVDRYIGDAVLAVFNHPFEQKEHLELAVLAGIAMAECCQRRNLRRPDGRPVAFRVGLHRGEVIVGNIGAGRQLEFTLIGDTIAIATRLASVGKENQLVALRKSFLGVRHPFELNPLGRLRLKGQEEPLECVRVVARGGELRRRIEEAVEAALDRVPMPSHLMNLYEPKE
ncbi:MAG: adenylate/guanylate cyclase domain-containing protein [Zetaproteobacteria bacterium]|nr:MAG: adenylate/guanylate cyclase domain-containing protein [Zetaproteobacteria bacterium]